MMAISIQHTGTVVSGRGKAGVSLAGFSDIATAYLGRPPVSGSLNLVLDQPVLLDAKMRYAVRDRRSLWPVTVNATIRALAYRWPQCPLHIVEIVSDVHLRDHLDLADGNQLHIAFDPGAERSLPLTSRLAWMTFWSGREKLYYQTNSRYTAFVNRTMRLVSRWADQGA